MRNFGALLSFNGRNILSKPNGSIDNSISMDFFQIQQTPTYFPAYYMGLFAFAMIFIFCTFGHLIEITVIASRKTIIYPLLSTNF